MKTRLFLLLCLMTCSSMAVAENGCPYGESPIGPRSEANPLGCVIDHDLNRPQVQPEQPQPPRGHWETRWGAIAMSSSGVITYAGVVKFLSKQSAQKAAIAQCKANGGGKSCKVGLAFYNQCGVIASGDTATVMQGGATIEIASGMGLKKCSNDTTNCKIYYSDCSPPVWMSY